MRSAWLFTFGLVAAGFSAASCEDGSIDSVKTSNSTTATGKTASGAQTTSGGGLGGAGGASGTGGESVSVNTGVGGAQTGTGPATGVTSSTVTTVSSSTGGMTCNMPADCAGKNTTCQTITCVNKQCGASNAAKFTACWKDGGSGASCDGAGKCAIWVPVSAGGAPAARELHTAVWTGSRMIIWGGTLQGLTPTNTGYSYDPKTDGWTAITTTNAPAARHSHQAVWTGTRMIVWGGYGTVGLEPQGGIYDPSTDSWKAMSITNEPVARTAHAMLYMANLNQVLVWGGRIGNNAINSGGKYDVATDKWTAITGTGAPSPRYNFSNSFAAPSAGHPSGLFFVWGGADTFNWFGDGASYDPGSDKWTPVNMTPGAMPNGGYPPQYYPKGTPVKMESANAFNGVGGPGSYIFGGWDGGNFFSPILYFWDGASMQPGGYWYGLKPGDPNAPSGRARYVGVVPSLGIFLWGGCNDMACGTVLADGSVWKPDNNGGTWSNFPSDPGLTARSEASIVWTGTDVIIWGGTDGNKPLGNGARRAVNPN